MSGFFKPDKKRVIYFTLFLALTYYILLIMNSFILLKKCSIGGDVIICEFSPLYTILFFTLSIPIVYFIVCLMVNNLRKLRVLRIFLQLGVLSIGIVGFYEVINKFLRFSIAKVSLEVLLISIAFTLLAFSLFYFELKKKQIGPTT